ncbi:MAG: hypothetical protein AAB558_02380, partial [Patescibacteria group bacterium]
MSQVTTTHRVIVRPNSTHASTLTDHQLLQLCTHYGTQAKLWKQKFLGLLPEVDRRKLYLTQGCSSLFEFGAKVGGVSKEQVSNVLRLYQRFEPTPVLKQALVSGEISVHKLARVVSVATPENQEFLLNQSKLLSNRALETLIQDTKRLHVQTKKPNKTVKVEQFEELGLSPQIKQRLLSLRNTGLNLNQLMEEFLNQREERIQEEKQKIAEELREKEGKRSQPAGPTTGQASRSIP